jgi:hypothetical protein
MPAALPLEGLRNSEMELRTMKPEDRRRSVKINAIGSTLWNQKLRWIQKEAIVNSEHATQWSLNSETKSYSVGPIRFQISAIDRGEQISRR